MSPENFYALLARLLPLIATIVISGLILFTLNRTLRRQWEGNPDAQFRFQLIMLALTAAAIVATVVALPIDNTLRGQLLSLIGILLSAAIALSSTTFIGNIMAGIMLKVIKSARPGDFITVADLTGRITEMGLLHTEIQTEFRDLVTIPNLYLVTQPIQVVRSSGTIVFAEVSLGYEVARTDVADILCQAAIEGGLKDPFVHVRELGDFSVLYRVAGLLEKVDSLISARSRLRESMLDALHEADVEVVSPTFMNSRVYAEDREFIPSPSRETTRTRPPAEAEDIVFDKAEEAALLEDLKRSIESLDEKIAELADDPDSAHADTIEQLEAEKSRMLERVETEQARLSE